MKEPDVVNTDWRAILYGLLLRQRGDLATDEIAFLVAERYPHTAPVCSR